MIKIITAAQAADLIKDGDTVAIGGFLGVGAPSGILDALVAKGTKDLVVHSSDSAFPNVGVGKLIGNNRIAHFMGSHTGTNKDMQALIKSNGIKLTLIPQGTFCERIRAAGGGLGGVLTPTGVGTMVAEGKQVITVNGKEFLLEEPLPSGFALVKAYKAGKAGNLVFRLSARNFNPIIAMGGKVTIVEAEHIVEIGELDPDNIHSPGVFTNYLVQA